MLDSRTAVFWSNVLLLSLSHNAQRSKRTCDTNVESTVGVTASPTVAVFILFMTATWSTARLGLVKLSSLEYSYRILCRACQWQSVNHTKGPRSSSSSWLRTWQQAVVLRIIKEV